MCDRVGGAKFLIYDPIPGSISLNCHRCRAAGTDPSSGLATGLQNHFPSLGPTFIFTGGWRPLQVTAEMPEDWHQKHFLNFAKSYVDEDSSAWAFCLG